MTASADPFKVDPTAARVASAMRLSAELAQASSMSSEAVFDALTELPENMLCLLDSPEGWAALAVGIVGQTGGMVRAYQPTLH